MYHMDATRNFSVPFSKVVNSSFPVKGVPFMILSFIILPIFVFTTVVGLYGMVEYCCVVLLWAPGVP